MADVYRVGDVWVYRGSAVGACPLRLLAGRLGFPPTPWDEDSLRRMNEGNLHEPHILERVAEKYGMPVTDQQREVVLPVTSTAAIVGHIDGLVGGDRLVEAKAFGKSTWELWRSKGLEGFEDYQAQLSAYMYGLGLKKAVFAVKSRESGVVDIKEIDEPPLSLAEVKAKVVRIEAAAAERKLTAVECDRYCMCNYRYLRPWKKAADGRDEVDLEPLADELGKAWEAILAEEKALKERRAVLARKVLELSGGSEGEHGEEGERLVGSGYWVQWGGRTPRRRHSLEKLEAAGHEKCPFEEEYNTSPRAIIQRRRKGAATNATDTTE